MEIAFSGVRCIKVSDLELPSCKIIVDGNISPFRIIKHKSGLYQIQQYSRSEHWVMNTKGSWPSIPDDSNDWVSVGIPKETSLEVKQQITKWIEHDNKPKI